MVVLIDLNIVKNKTESLYIDRLETYELSIVREYRINQQIVKNHLLELER